jgi:hypothetical protein
MTEMFATRARGWRPDLPSRWPSEWCYVVVAAPTASSDSSAPTSPHKHGGKKRRLWCLLGRAWRFHLPHLLQSRSGDLNEPLFLAGDPAPIAHVRVVVEVPAAHEPEQLVDVVGGDIDVACPSGKPRKASIHHRKNRYPPVPGSSLPGTIAPHPHNLGRYDPEHLPFPFLEGSTLLPRQEGYRNIIIPLGGAREQRWTHAGFRGDPLWPAKSLMTDPRSGCSASIKR